MQTIIKTTETKLAMQENIWLQQEVEQEDHRATSDAELQARESAENPRRNAEHEQRLRHIRISQNPMCRQ